MVSHKVVLSRKVVLSWQALFRVPQVVSLGTSGGCVATLARLGVHIAKNLSIFFPQSISPYLSHLADKLGRMSPCPQE